MIPPEIEKYITDFIEYSKFRGEYVIRPYGGSLVITYQDGTKAKLTLNMWQPEIVTLDETEQKN